MRSAHTMPAVMAASDNRASANGRRGSSPFSVKPRQGPLADAMPVPSNTRLISQGTADRGSPARSASAGRWIA